MAAEQWTIGRLLETASPYLRDKGSESPRLDAELLLAETLGLDRIGLYTQFDRPLSASEVDTFRAFVARRAAHEPVAYIVGRAHFRHLVLEVGPAVLIPRPETEELVEAALRSLRRRPPWDGRPARAPVSSGAAEGAESGGTLAAEAASSTGSASDAVPSAPLVADVGTGSGAIALSLAQEAGVRVLAIDSSADALEVAGANARSLGLAGAVDLVQADLLAGVPDGSLHMVVSNPPYVKSGDMSTLAPDVREYEPTGALEAGAEGLDVIRRLLPEAVRVLRPGGSLLMEVGDGQASEVEEAALHAGFAWAGVHRDMSGKDRIVEAIMPGTTELPVVGLDEPRVAVLREALQAGAIIGVPTDTVYGLAAGWNSAAGVRGLFAAKGRAEEQIVAVLFSSVADVTEQLPDLDPRAARVLNELLPGPYTFVVSTTVPRAPLVGTSDSLGVRVPDHPGLLALVAAVGAPLAATSANLSGEADAASLQDVDPNVLAQCSAGFTSEAKEGADQGGPTQVGGAASTVVDLRPLAEGGEPVVLRVGAVSEKEVLDRIGALGGAWGGI